MAQLVERTLGKGEVGSSNLPISTTILSPSQLKIYFNVSCWGIDNGKSKI
jgi:hypothetical protein